MSEANTHQLPYTDSQLNIAFGKMINFEPSLSSTSTDFVTSNGLEPSLGTYSYSNFKEDFFNTNYSTDTSSNTRVLTVQAIVNGATVSNSETDTWWTGSGTNPNTVVVPHGLGKIPRNIHWGFTNYASNTQGYPSGGARIEPSGNSIVNAMVWADATNVYWKYLPTFIDTPSTNPGIFIIENNPTIVSNGTTDGSPYRGTFILTYDYLGSQPTVTHLYEWNHSDQQWNGASPGAYGNRFVFNPSYGTNGRWTILYSGNNTLVAANDADEPWLVSQWTGTSGNTNVWLQNPTYNIIHITGYGQQYPVFRNTLVRLQLYVED